MKACFRLKKNYQYNYVYKHAQSVADKHFVLLFCKSKKTQSQVGFSVSKKYGHAVQRNRIRRQMKAAAAQFMPQVKNGYNLVIVPRRQGEYEFGQIVESIKSLLEKADLFL